MRVFIGYDPREHDAYLVAEHTLRQTSGIQADCLDDIRLRAHGMYWRDVDRRGAGYDLPSNAPVATDFATTRFMVPLLCHTGWALFTDCDMVFLDDVHHMLLHARDDKAVIVCKHKHAEDGTKMMGKRQESYPRKNWSSVMLFNCDHPANKRLTLTDINNRPGRDLHAFYWLHESEIGSMPLEWNWLVGVQPKPEHPKIAHFTKGGPWLHGWPEARHDHIWREAARGAL